MFYSISILLILLVFKDGSIDIIEASIFVAIYIIYLITLSQWNKFVEIKEDQTTLEKVEEIFEKKKNAILEKFFPSSKKCYLTFFISILIIAGLSWVLVESAIEISAILGIPEAIVALTVLAIGTSVPDTVSSVIVAKQGRGGMAISNAIGSNIFDILVGLGLPWLVFLAINGGTIPVSTENLYSSVVLLFATVFVIFFLFLLRRWKIGRKSGYFLIILYVLYLIWAVLNL
jgi:Ca2+/Na+ antiporter